MNKRYKVERHPRLGDRRVNAMIAGTRIPLGPVDGPVRKRSFIVTLSDNEVAKKRPNLVLTLMAEPAPGLAAKAETDPHKSPTKPSRKTKQPPKRKE